MNLELGSSGLISRNWVASSWLGGTMSALSTGGFLSTLLGAEYMVFAQQMNGWLYLPSEPKSTG